MFFAENYTSPELKVKPALLWCPLAALLAEPGTLKVCAPPCYTLLYAFYVFLMVYLTLLTPNYYRTNEKTSK